MSSAPLPDIAGTTASFIGFGEAAMAFVTGWDGNGPGTINAYDIKTDANDDVAEQKRQDYSKSGVVGCDTLAEALAGSDVIFSMVTASQALSAAQSAAAQFLDDSLFFDCNSCAPGTKNKSAAIITSAGGRYVDVAIMAPVHPKLHQTPVLISGSAATAAAELMARLDMSARIVPGDVGRASSIKMIRSIMVKGIEALVAECVLAGRRAGVDEEVLASLNATYPGFDWQDRAAYMLERVMTHGVRRAEEMDEVAITVDDLGLDGRMARATAKWQRQIGRIDWTEMDGDYIARADSILAELMDPEGKQ